LTRLKAIFVSMFKHNPGGADYRGSQAVRSFSHPMDGTYDFDKEVELQIQIGSKLYPEYPIRNLAEAYYQLRKKLGIHFSNDSINIRKSDYAGESFIMAIDLENILGASFTGTKTMSGDLLTIKLNSVYLQIPFTAEIQHTLYYTLIYDSILNINLSGTNVLE